MVRKLLLLLTLVMLPGVARAEWYEASSAHFVVYANDAPERLKKFADDLERFDQAVRLLRGLPNAPVDKANRVTVYMLPSIESVGRLYGDQMVAGFYQPSAGASVAFVPQRGRDRGGREAQLILFHEYSHHLMLSIFANSAFPVWLVEGWAEFHSTATIQKDGSVQFGAAPKDRATGLMLGNPLPLERILSADTAHLSDEQRDAFYGRSWALMHYLTFNPARNAQLARYLAEINSGRTAAQAAAVFGDLEVLHRELEAFLIGSMIRGITVLADKIAVGPIAVRKLAPGEAATMYVRILSKRGVDKKTAPSVYLTAKTAAEPFPDDPGAQIVLAEAAYDAGKYAESEAACDRAIAADPKAIDAHLRKAMARMAIADKKNDDSRETWRGIRAIIAAANRLDPEDPRPLVLYYQSFLMAHQPPTKNAKDGLYHAFELAPYDLALRANVAYMLWKDGKPAQARVMLMPLAFNPHGGALAKMAVKMIAEIDAKDAAPAVPAAKSGGR